MVCNILDKIVVGVQLVVGHEDKEEAGTLTACGHDHSRANCLSNRQHRHLCHHPYQHYYSLYLMLKCHIALICML